STPQTLALARRAYDPANTRPRVEFRTLTLDGAPIAACLNLVTRDNAAAFKCAYDERHARFSPGLVLDAALADEADAGAFGPLLDSVSVEGHPVRRLWVDGVRVGAGAISLAGGFSGLAGAILNVDRMRSRAWSMGRALYRRVSPRG
ncbi:MAG TPA: GNAT family N-acetyltransferase, partial [Beijerinckiaceae bacterium]